MPIKVTCECGKVTNVPDAYAGRTGKCPACKRPVKVPLLQPAAVAEPAAPQPAYHSPAPKVSAPRYEPEPEQAAEPEPQPQYEAEQERTSEPEADESPVAEEVPSYETSESAPLAPPAPVAGVPMTAPSANGIQIPTSIPDALRQPECPPIYFVISTEGALIKTKFDPSPVLVAMVNMFARKLKKVHDLRLETPPQGEEVPVVYTRVTRLTPGSRFLRSFGILALFGPTWLEVDGNIHLPSKQPVPFHFKSKAYIGWIFGGNSRNLLIINAKVIAKKIAKTLKKQRREQDYPLGKCFP